MNNIKNSRNDELFKAILSLKTVEECYDFFQDLCTYKEIEAMSTRLEAAKLLSEGHTYEEILKKIDISSATLSRVSKCIKYGPGGYESVINRMNKK
ncbi:YerC/YecD family TrpR-related protein [Fusobacterium sp. PH5-44]|uniref:YerC/YecD family TrpR-related protein n=1 Tax=unclassified Fusobacterium TaxID=2648384 RepID=UPI003D25F99E